MKKQLLFLFLILQLSAYSQVVNIENQYLEDKREGFSGALDLSFSIQKQTDALISLSFKPIFQYRFGPKKSKKTLYFGETISPVDSTLTQDTLSPIDSLALINDSIKQKKKDDNKSKHLILLYHDINYTASKGKTFSNFGLSHLRYVYNITDNWKSESYSQIQYNQLLLQKIRYQLGSGIRANILNIKAVPGGYKKRAIRISAGTSLFFEYNEINHSNRPLEKTAALKWNTYLSTYMNFKHVEFTSTTYIQPNLGDFKDFRSSGDYSVLFRVTEPFSIKFVFSYYYDSRPPDETPGNTYSFTAGFVYKLNRFKEKIRSIQKKYQVEQEEYVPDTIPEEEYEIIIDN